MLAGKSYTLRRVIQALKDKYRGNFDANVAKTASTGIASIQIEGWSPNQNPLG